MSRGEGNVGLSAAALRRAFDASFAAPPPPPAPGIEDVLAIRLGTAPYVLLLSEIAGLYAGRQLAPVPSACVELLGIAALRGQIVPVYDLGALLGQPRVEVPRWFVLGPAPLAIGLAFAEFEGPLRLEQASFARAESERAAHRHVRGVVRVAAVARSIVDVGSVLQELSGAAGAREGAVRNG